MNGAMRSSLVSKLIFKLNGVSDEEANGVRTALTNSEIDCYETPGSRWGWSMPAIWVKRDEDYATAREIIEDFQASYVREVRASKDERPRWNVVKVVLALILTGIVLYIFNSFWLHML